MGDGLITIDALGAAVAAALEGADSPDSGRVRAIPDVRTIRYYTTLGLLDRPAEMRGRTALYGERHVLQLVAVKRLQAEGLSLADIQEQLAGLTEAKLRRLARIEGSIAIPTDARPATRVAPVDDKPMGDREDFWRAIPAETPATADTFAAESRAPQALRLSPHVLLIAEHVSPLDDGTRRRLTALAAPLIEALETLAATGGPEEEG